MINIRYKSLEEALPKNGREIQYMLTKNRGLNIFGALGHVGYFSYGVVSYGLTSEDGEGFDVGPDENYTPGETYEINGEKFTCKVYLGKESSLGAELIYPNPAITLYWCDVSETLREFFDDPLLCYIKEGVEDGVIGLEVTSKEKCNLKEEVFWRYTATLTYKSKTHKMWAHGLENNAPEELSWHYEGEF